MPIQRHEVIPIRSPPPPFDDGNNNTSRDDASRCACAHPLLVPSYVMAVLGLSTLLGGLMCMVGPLSAECSNNLRVGLSVAGALLAVIAFGYCVIIQCIHGRDLQRWRNQRNVTVMPWSTGLEPPEPPKPPAYLPRDTAPPPYSPPRTPDTPERPQSSVTSCGYEESVTRINVQNQTEQPPPYAE